MCITMRELVADTVAVHGVRWTAQHYSKRIPFALMYWLVFGRAPRALRNPPHAYNSRYNCLTAAQSHVAVSLGAL